MTDFSDPTSAPFAMVETPNIRVEVSLPLGADQASVDLDITEASILEPFPGMSLDPALLLQSIRRLLPASLEIEERTVEGTRFDLLDIVGDMLLEYAEDILDPLPDDLVEIELAAVNAGIRAMAAPAPAF